MAFNRSNFDPIPSSKGLANRATYETTDTLATVEGANYFDAAADNLRSPFQITVFASDGQASYMGTKSGTVVSLGGDLEERKIRNYTLTMANSTKAAQTVAADDWVEIKIAGTQHFLPAYLIS